MKPNKHYLFSKPFDGVLYPYINDNGNHYRINKYEKEILDKLVGGELWKYYFDELVIKYRALYNQPLNNQDYIENSFKNLEQEEDYDTYQKVLKELGDE